MKITGRRFIFSVLMVVASRGLFAVDSLNYERDIRPVLSRKCFSCHNTGTAKGGVNLDNYKEKDRVIKDGAFWLKVLDQIKNRTITRQQSGRPA